MTFLGPDDHRLDGTPEENEKKLERLRSVGQPMPDIEIGIMAAGRACSCRRARRARSASAATAS